MSQKAKRLVFNEIGVLTLEDVLDLVNTGTAEANNFYPYTKRWRGRLCMTRVYYCIAAVKISSRRLGKDVLVWRASQYGMVMDMLASRIRGVASTPREWRDHLLLNNLYRRGGEEGLLQTWSKEEGWPINKTCGVVVIVISYFTQATCVLLYQHHVAQVSALPIPILYAKLCLRLFTYLLNERHEHLEDYITHATSRRNEPL